ncbi:MAG: hypothetical protein JWR36_1813 [Glaciihabitans sp.]|jgi:hypothetical protein|nr:hypothetical protein [Glaciihabitans sp.]MDQ1571923.1 hypothetical protein [Actinomycetota bacterium]
MAPAAHDTAMPPQLQRFSATLSGRRLVTSMKRDTTILCSTGDHGFFASGLTALTKRKGTIHAH